MESTYGTRLHEKIKRDHTLQLAEVIRDTMRRGGNVVIPAFAVGRTQVMLSFIRQIKDQNLVPENNDFPVYVDSPMAVEATGIFEDNESECYDEEARALLNQGINPLAFPNLHLSITTEESMAINDDRVPKVILSASGMWDFWSGSRPLRRSRSRSLWFTAMTKRPLLLRSAWSRRRS